MAALLLCTVLLTSTLSGVFGMAGGMVLLGVLLLLLPVADAMVLHGVTQAVANAARAALSFRYIRPRIVGFFTVGSALVLALLGLAGLRVSEGVALILLGIVPLSEPLWKSLRPRSIERPSGALAAGAVVTALHLFAGTGGPLLDLFFVRSKLDRHAIVATKAAAQTVGHLSKVAYFALALRAAEPGTLNTLTWLGLGAAAIFGTYLGKLILDRISESSFRHGARALIYGSAALCLARGTWSLLT